MKNKVVVAMVALLLTFSLASCGEIDSSSTTTNAGKTEDSSTVSDDVDESVVDDEQEDSSEVTTLASSEKSEDSVQYSESQAESSNGEFTELTGYFKESINGQESNYIVLNSNSQFIIGIGATTSVPVKIDQTADTILVNRGGVSDDTTPCKYTYDGTTLTFTEGDVTYEWTKLEYIPVSGKYYGVDDEGTNIGEVTFNSDGTGTTTFYGTDDSDSETTDFTFTQTATTFDLTATDGSKVSYSSYTYDVFNLDLTRADDGSVENLVLADS